MKLIIKIIIAFATVLQSYSAFAQSKADKVEALRANFITKKLELTASESEKFWPLYNELNDKINALRKNVRKTFTINPEKLTDAEAEEVYQIDIRSKVLEAEVYKQYSEKIKAAIGVKKAVKLRIAEQAFKREVINSIKDKSD
jgi:hypothetical protein